MTLFALRDMEPNPFRHMDRYPLKPDKIAALKESIATTTFWDNVVAREVGGKAQIAYGHHRLVALRESFPPEHGVRLIIRDLDDTAMLQIMARENLEEWGTSAEVEHETVRAVVEAYAAGRVELPAPGVQANAAHMRYAPSFIIGNDTGQARHHPYSAPAVAEFLAWPIDKVGPILQALALIEEGTLHEDDFKGLGGQQAVAVTREATTAKKRMIEKHGPEHEKEAKAMGGYVARAVRDKMVDGGLGYKQARSVTDEMVQKVDSATAPKNLDSLASKAAGAVNELLRDDAAARRLQEVMPFADDIGKFARRDLLTALRVLGERVDAYIDSLTPIGIEASEVQNA